MKKNIGLAIVSGVVCAGMLLAPRLRPKSTQIDWFLPPNDMKIPVHAFGTLGADSGLSERQFNQVLDVVQKIYAPVVKSRGGKLVFKRLWSNPTVNSDARRSGKNYIIDSYGGLARFPGMTQDGYAAVACHEMGHHVGGAPLFTGDTWASVEGQADYFANLKCLRRVFTDADSQGFTRPSGVDPLAQQSCAQAFADPADQAACVREAMTGVSLAGVLASLKKQPLPTINTPDSSVVDTTFEGHPEPQCRLDTYFQASLCAQPVSAELNEKDPAPGACTLSQNFKVGMRPLCWYKPSPNELVPGGNVTVASIPADLRTQPSAEPASGVFSTLKSASLWLGN